VVQTKEHFLQRKPFFFTYNIAAEKQKERTSTSKLEASPMGSFPVLQPATTSLQQMAETNGVRWCHRSHLVGAAFPVHLTGVY
jgi:hypothetical protein